MKKQLVPVVAVILFGLIGVSALYQPGLWTAHDIWHNVARFYWYVTALKEGQIMPAWIAPMANGYGYPLFIFSYHLPWIIGAPLVLFGVEFELALKLVYGLSFVVAGLTMYVFSFRVFKNRWSALTSAVLYMWAPYHFLIIFVAAAAGIAWAYALVPLIFWGIWEIMVNRNKLGVGLLATGLAGVALSHLIFTFMLIPFFLLFIVVLVWLYGINKQKLGLGVLGVLLGLGLAGFYLAPFIAFSPLIKANDPGLGFRNLYETNFASIEQLIYSPWGFGPITSNAKDGEISLQIGIAQWLSYGLATIFGAIWWVKWHWQTNMNFKYSEFNKAKISRRKKMGMGLFLYLLFFFGVLSVWEISKPIWQVMARYVPLDYPFRMLILAVFFGSLLAGWFVHSIKDARMRYLYAIFLVTLALYTNRNHMRVNLYTQIPVKDYVEAEKTTNTLDEYLPLMADRSLLNMPRVNTWTQWNFPGQEAYILDQAVSVTTSKSGLIEVLNNTEQTPRIIFNKPIIFMIGNLISIGAIVVMGGLVLWLIIKDKK